MWVSVYWRWLAASRWCKSVVSIGVQHAQATTQTTRGGRMPQRTLPVIGQNALGCKNGSVVAGLVQGTAAADGR